MSVNLSELNVVIREMNELSSKASLNKREERRLSTLMVFSKAIQNGASLQELEQEAFNDESRAAGLPVTNFRKNRTLSKEQETELRGWMALAEHGTKREVRDMGVGNLIAQLGTYTGLGTFVPTEFFPAFFKSLQYVDALFDENSVTFVKSTNGRPMPFPLMSDTENDAAPNTEGQLLTETDIALTSHLVLGAYSFMTPIFIASIEAWQDVETAATTLQLFKDFARDRFARASGKYLVAGSGIEQPTGLLTRLSALNVPTVVASGSSANTGGSETGQTTVGTDDIANMIQKLDPAYLASPKCAFMMNMNTFTTLLRTKDKFGRPLVDFVNGARTFFGFPIKICPNLPNMSASTQGAIVLGDWQYWATRVCYDETSGVQVFAERFAELGKVGMRLFARVDGGILWDGDANSNCPFVMLQQHS